MNTPRTKPLTRYGSPRKPVQRASKQPDGHYKLGLRDERYLRTIGQIATYFPLIENSMVEILGDLLGGDHGTGRQVFYSITNQNIRIKVMTALLEKSSVNQKKDDWYDRVISDFAGISSSRNDYVHHIWWTHNSGRIFLAAPSVDDFSWHEGREVTLSELVGVADRMGDLLHRLQMHRAKQFEARMQRLALQQKHLQPYGAESRSAPTPLDTDGEAPEPQSQSSDPSPRSGD